MVGAVLVQHTNWKNVEHAINNLREANLLEVQKLVAASDKQLEALIQPAGYFRRKTKRLRSLMEFVAYEYQGSIEAMKQVDLVTMREQLLDVHGIGPETADAILLYALEKPALVVDTYTHRIYARHGWIEDEADYHQLQSHLASELPVDVDVFNELHALLVEVGKRYCRKTPKCQECPLVGMLPEEGFVTV